MSVSNNKYRNDIVIPTDSADDPLEKFEVVDVKENVFNNALLSFGFLYRTLTITVPLLIFLCSFTRFSAAGNLYVTASRTNQLLFSVE